MIQVSEDIVPAVKFKRQQSAMLRRLRETGRPLVITQHGTPAAVVLTPEGYDLLMEESRFRQALREAERADRAGHLVPHEDALKRFEEAIEPRDDS